MGTVCQKCGYERKDDDIAHHYECPKCGIVYKKISNAKTETVNQSFSAAPQERIECSSKKINIGGKLTRLIIIVALVCSVYFLFMKFSVYKANQNALSDLNVAMKAQINIISIPSFVNFTDNLTTLISSMRGGDQEIRQVPYDGVNLEIIKVNHNYGCCCEMTAYHDNGDKLYRLIMFKDEKYIFTEHDIEFQVDGDPIITGEERIIRRYLKHGIRDIYPETEGCGV